MTIEAPDDSRADKKKLGYVGSTPGSKAGRDSNAWFTPTRYIDAAREALGGVIDLDPFSDTKANEKINARKFFSEHDDAFIQDWSLGQQKPNKLTVWMNPPYSGALCSAAVSMFIDEYEKGSFAEGIFLVNNATETKWFQRAFTVASAVVFTNHRISFWNIDGKAVSGNTRGQAFFYFGKNPKQFIKAFDAIGAGFKLK